MVLSQARQRAGVRQPGAPPKKTHQLKRPALRRPLTASTAAAPPPSAASAGSGSLASLLLSNTDTARYLQPNAPKIRKHYPRIEPDDYWKSLRGWDFMAELNARMGSNHGSPDSRS